MSDEQSAKLLAQWRDGDQQAATDLFHRYADRLIALARSRLSSKLSHRVDPEDVVQSVYRSFFADSREGRFDLQRSGDLWRLLVVITLNKLYDQVRRASRAKRAVSSERGFRAEDGLIDLVPQLAASEPSPLEAVALADELEQFMRRLHVADRRVLELRLQGYNLEEIAAQTQRGERTVRRVLKEVKQQLADWYLKSCRS